MFIVQKDESIGCLKLGLQLVNLVLHFQHLLFVEFNQVLLCYFILQRGTQIQITVVKMKRIV